MKLSEVVKPISYLKAHASELIRDVVEQRKTLVITQHGEAKVIVQDVHVYEETQESLALLKILAQSAASLNKGKIKPLKATFASVRKRVAHRI